MKIITHNNGILTPRELETVKWIALGKTNWDISRILSVTEQTTANRISIIFNKLNAVNRAHAVAKAIFKGAISIQVLTMALLINASDIEQRRGARRQSRRRDEFRTISTNRIVYSYYIPNKYS